MIKLNMIKKITMLALLGLTATGSLFGALPAEKEKELANKVLSKNSPVFFMTSDEFSGVFILKNREDYTAAFLNDENKVEKWSVDGKYDIKIAFKEFKDYEGKYNPPARKDPSGKYTFVGHLSETGVASHINVEMDGGVAEIKLLPGQKSNVESIYIITSDSSEYKIDIDIEKVSDSWMLHRDPAERGKTMATAYLVAVQKVEKVAEGSEIKKLEAQQTIAKDASNCVFSLIDRDILEADACLKDITNAVVEAEKIVLGIPASSKAQEILARIKELDALCEMRFNQYIAATVLECVIAELEINPIKLNDCLNSGTDLLNDIEAIINEFPASAEIRNVAEIAKGFVNFASELAGLKTTEEKTAQDAADKLKAEQEAAEKLRVAQEAADLKVAQEAAATKQKAEQEAAARQKATEDAARKAAQPRKETPQEKIERLSRTLID